MTHSGVRTCRGRSAMTRVLVRTRASPSGTRWKRCTHSRRDEAAGNVDPSQACVSTARFPGVLPASRCAAVRAIAEGAYGCRSCQPDDLASTHDRRAMRGGSKAFGNLPSGCRGTDLGRYSPAPAFGSRNLRARAATTRSDRRRSRRSWRQVDPFGHHLALHITMTSAA